MNYETLAQSQLNYKKQVEDLSPKLKLDFQRYVEKTFLENNIEMKFQNFYCTYTKSATLRLSATMPELGKNYTRAGIHETIKQIKQEFPKAVNLEEMVEVDIDHGFYEFI